MSAESVFLLTFANDSDQSFLDQLDAERQGIVEKLLPIEQSGYIRVHVEPQARIQDIFKAFSLYRGRIKVFHYGGHANGTHLALDEEMGNGQGLAQLIKEENRVQKQESKDPSAGIELVFLNGCATLDQMHSLFEAGVKSVLVTSIPINDTQARKFALELYQALAIPVSIQEAYDRAVAFLQTYNRREATEMSQNRDVSMLPEFQSDQIPWGLYYAKGISRAEWQIPTAPTESEWDQLRNLVGQDIKKALKKMDELVKKHHLEEDFEDTLILQKGRYHRLENDWMNAFITKERFDIDRSRISQALLHMVSQMKEASS